ncbi:UNVERIFIED_CONTAM: hypothetical protein GTU68_021982, partial [Idotea baltica]|nr:hypothetical protein [Idotea baltica]
MATSLPKAGVGNPEKRVDVGCSTSRNQGQTTKNMSNMTIGKRTDKDFIFGKLIGEGSFSSVYLAKDIHSNKEYAIKTCEKFHIKKENKIQSILREKEVMYILNNKHDKTTPFFVKLYYAFQCDSYLYFVMTYCKNGELLKWIKNVGNFDRKSSSFYSAEIVKALEHLHDLNIVHRDLKPENIILDENMHIKITDFGSAKILTNGEIGRRSSFVGTAQYVSPEVLESRAVTPAADLWALGCIIYQMVSGLPPFNDPSEYLITKQILKLDYVFPDLFDEDAKDLVQKLLVLEDRQRLGATDEVRYTSLRSHPFFEDIDMDTLYKQVPPEICIFMPELEETKMAWEDRMAPGLIPEVIKRIEFENVGVSPSRKPEEGWHKNLRLTLEEHKLKLTEQEKNNIYHEYVDGNLILKQGLLDKRKGLFARRRMFLLTTGPRLFYVDPVNKVLKGEVPWSSTLRPDPRNFKNFFLHT